MDEDQPQQDSAATNPTGGEVDQPERRSFMKTAGVVTAAAAGAAFGKFGSAPITVAQAQTAAGGTSSTSASGETWWPSKWGADDEAGASNHITPAKVLEVAKSIRDGRIYKIGRVYEAGMPLFGARVFALRIPGAPTGGPFGGNNMVYNDEFVTAEIGQIGTQFDGLGHIGVQTGKAGDLNDMRFYNGVTMAEMASAYGLKKLGVEKLKPLFTNGHLVDIAGLKGRMLEAGEEISLADVRAALKRQDMAEDAIKPGDGIFFNTGWGQLWMKNNDRFNGGEPGIGLEVARWVIEKDLCLTGADTWAVEVVPNPDKNLAFPVHVELQTKHGILNHENLVFDDLIADRKYQFVYIFSPMALKGATASGGTPIAIT
ncbi:cyclase [Skermanella stibiiresistens SB22]|uniref:Cyclase n=1 Tax=Skermanella stibiiresistens SB22 TaxID=1385369 RepID=W9HAG6_9PROT|nr:cyclase family protein [Skermanella stibiiresistens]EWY41731.1 cyclase [Skermanella stibiiresistens SB22]